MSKLIVMCGLPGSGKSVYVKNNFTSKGEVIISMDSVRQELFGDSRCQHNNAKVSKVALAKVDVKLSEGHTVVFDATSITKEHRANLINLAKKHGSKSTILYKKMELEDLLMVNKYRDTPIPERSLCYIRLKLEEPESNEADELILI